MKAQRISSFAVLITIVFVALLPMVFAQNSAEKATRADMEQYFETFVNMYSETAEKNVRLEYRDFLPFYNFKNGIMYMSNVHGAGIIFVHSPLVQTTYQTTDKRIECAIFSNECILPCGWFPQNNLTIYGSGVLSSLTTDNKCYLIIPQNATWTIADLSVFAGNSQFNNNVLIKGSNLKADWSNDSAEIDAKKQIDNDIQHVQLILNLTNSSAILQPANLEERGKSIIRNYFNGNISADVYQAEKSSWVNDFISGTIYDKSFAESIWDDYGKSVQNDRATEIQNQGRIEGIELMIIGAIIGLISPIIIKKTAKKLEKTKRARKDEKIVNSCQPFNS
jgi:hypothetical protein